MSQAEELLDSLSENDISAYTAEPEVEPHIIIGSDRFITVPDMLKRIAVQFDHNIETVTFDCPRYWDEHDMSEMKVFINYMRADGFAGSYYAETVTIDENDSNIMHFDWTIKEEVTLVKGALSFLVCIKKTDDGGILENHWNSELNKDMYISAGMNCQESILSEYPDIVTDLLTRMENVESVVNWSAIADLHTKIDTNIAAVNEKIDTNIAAVNEKINTDVGALNTTVTDNITAINGELETLSENVNGLDTQLEAVHNSVENCKIDISALQDADTDLYNRINAISIADVDAVSALSERVDSVHEEVTNFKNNTISEINTLTENIASVHSEVVSVRDETASVTDALAAKDTELQQSIGDVSAKVNEIYSGLKAVVETETF